MSRKPESCLDVSDRCQKHVLFHSNEFLSPKVFALDGCFSREKTLPRSGSLSCVDGSSVDGPSGGCLYFLGIKTSYRRDNYRGLAGESSLPDSNFGSQIRV